MHTNLSRLPAVLVSTKLALTGLLAISLPLIKWPLNTCGHRPLTILSWWATTALGALVGGLLLHPHDIWAVGRGTAAWSVLLWAAVRPTSA